MGAELVRCPVCQRQFDPQGSPAMPFCCDRCRLIDLKRWVDEEYGLLYERSDGDKTPAEE